MNAHGTYPFTINGHLGISIDVQVGYLGNGRDVLHVGGITAGAEDASNFGAGIDVMRCNECPCCVVYERLEFNWKPLNWDIGQPLFDDGCCGRTYFSSEFRNIVATSCPSVFGAPNPLVQRIRTP